MRGTWSREGSSWVLRLQSEEYAGDHRVLGSTRTVIVEADTLVYEMSMTTTSTNQMEPHLQAFLTRQP